MAALQAEAKDSENEAERQKLQLEEAREEGDRLQGQLVEVGGVHIPKADIAFVASAQSCLQISHVVSDVIASGSLTAAHMSQCSTNGDMCHSKLGHPTHSI